MKKTLKTIVCAVMALTTAVSCSDNEDPISAEVYEGSYLEITPGDALTPDETFEPEFMDEVPCSEEKMEDEERKSSYTTTSKYYFTLSVCGNKSVLETSQDDKTSTNYKIYKRTKLTYSAGRYNACNGLYTVVVSCDEIKAKYSEHDDSELRLIYKLDNYQRIKSTETDEVVNRITNETTFGRYVCNGSSLHFADGTFEYQALPEDGGYLLKQLKPEEREYKLERAE